MKQPHTETSIDHTDDQQNTGNHKVPGAEDAGGADRFGGTRSGAENIEGDSKSPQGRKEAVEAGPNVDRVSGLDGSHPGSKQAGASRERHPERDEHGRL